MNIWIASADNNLEKVQNYIENQGLHPNSKDENGYTPLHAAAEYGHLDLLTYLISKGGDINVKDNDGDTPLHACESVRVAEYLLEKGADLKAENNEGLTPLAKAEEDSEFLDLIQFFQLKSGVAVTKNEEDQTYNQITDEQRERLQSIIESGTDADFENYLRECIESNIEETNGTKRARTE